MTDIEQELADHGRFARADGAFAPTTNDWDATVAVDGETVEIAVVVPTLDAATNDDVAEVVEDGWYDTFERRVRDADSVTLAADVDVRSVGREGGDITVEIAFTPRSGKAADDALALVNYVEGTWFQGVIPGYDYVGRVERMRQQAAQNAESTEGTPL